jgi:hypothetical protein
MITFFFVALSSAAILVPLTFWAVTRAAEGYEDVSGFHYGEMPAPKPGSRPRPKRRRSVRRAS